MNTVKSVTPIILKITPAAGKNYTIEQLWELAKQAQTPAEFQVTKALENSDGSVSAIDNVSDKSAPMSVILNGAIYRNSRGTVSLFMGHTCGAVTIPGKPIRVSTLDDKGQLTGNKEADATGFTGDTTFVTLVWDEGSQSGEIRRYVNASYDVKLGTMGKIFPIDDPDNDTTPVPTNCHKPVDEDTINA